MNRSILIIICDFLLVSLITFSNFDSLMPPKKEEPQELARGTESTGNKELVGAMKKALEDERTRRENLSTELTRSRTATKDQESVLNERDSKLRELGENLQKSEARAVQLQGERETLEKQVKTSQQNFQSLQGELASTRSNVQLSASQLESLRTAQTREQREAEALRIKLAELEKNQEKIQQEKQQLDTRAQVAEAERKLALEQVSSMKGEIQAVRAEKAQLQASTKTLAEGVTALAEKSSALTQEIRENRALPANSVFNDFSTNRIETAFESVREGAFGSRVKREKKSRSLLVSDGSQTFAIYHLAETPLGGSPPGTVWTALTGNIARGDSTVPIRRVSFLVQDPRVLVIPISEPEARKLGSKIYRIAPDPFKFAEAVLVGAGENYFGECRFVIDPAAPKYVKMDRSFFKGFFGKFNPSRGDLVLSKTGEVLGVMVNNEYCVVLGKIAPDVTLIADDTLKAQQAGKWLDNLDAKLRGLPLKLQ